MSKWWFYLAGGAIAGYLYWRNREDMEDKVRRTAKQIRRNLEPMEENITGRLDDFAEAIVGLNKRIRVATRVVDAALGRIA